MKKLFSVLLAVLMLATCVLAVSADENDFVPSIELKPGPGIVPGTTEDGTPSYGEIVMPDGTVIPLPEGSIVITPIAKADSAADEIENALKEAYDKLVGADSLEDLIENLEEILGDIDAEDLVITDLFHVDVTGEYENYVDEGGKIHITLSATDDLIAALIEKDGAFKTLFGDNFIDNGDGTYTLIIDGDGIFAFLKNAASVDVDPDNPDQDSPTTGDTTYVYVIGAVVFAMMAGALLVASKKQKA